MTNLERKVNALYDVLFADAEHQAAAMEEAWRIFQDNTEVNTTKLVKCRTEEILSNLGIRENLGGYDALVKAISMVVENPIIIHNITTVLYPEVAKVINSTPSRTERLIRHAIETMFERCDNAVIIKFFGNSVSLHTGKCTNSEFIAKVARKIRREIYDD